MSDNLDSYIERLNRGETLLEKEVEELCGQFKAISARESNVVHLEAPVTVVETCMGKSLLN